MCIAVDPVENPVVVADHFAVISIFPRVAWSDVRKRLKYLDPIDDGGTDFSSRIYALLVLPIVPNYFRQVA